MNHFDYDTRMGYYLKPFDSDSEIHQEIYIHRHATYDVPKYHELATLCVNYELRRNYSLMAQTQVKYCITNTDDIRTTLGSINCM